MDHLALWQPACNMSDINIQIGVLCDLTSQTAQFFELFHDHV